MNKASLVRAQQKHWSDTGWINAIAFLTAAFLTLGTYCVDAQTGDHLCKLLLLLGGMTVTYNGIIFALNYTYHILTEWGSSE